MAWVIVDQTEWNSLVNRITRIDTMLGLISPKITRIDANITKLMTEESTIMVDVAALKTQIDDLTAQVTAEKTVEDGAVTLLTRLSGMVADLGSQLSNLSAGTVTQEQIDALAAQVKASADTIQQNAGTLAAAITQNTPAATPGPAPEPPPAPAPDPAPQA